MSTIDSTTKPAPCARRIVTTPGAVRIELAADASKAAVIPHSSVAHVLAAIARARDPKLHRICPATDRFTRADGNVWRFDERRNPPTLVFRLEDHTGNFATGFTIADPQLRALETACRVVLEGRP